MINAYRVRGHLIADLDPLGREPTTIPSWTPKPTASPSGTWTANSSPAAWAKPSATASPKPVATLREILETLRQTYCGKIGCEYMNIQVPEQKRWLQQRMEPAGQPLAARAAKRALRILRNLIDAEEFEHFLHSRFIGQKRFALEGGKPPSRFWKRSWSAPPPTMCMKS